jgi:hypothetical protein
MFIDEARISARLNHSNIGQIFEFGKAGDSYFIAMEFIQGVDLRAIHKVFRKQKIPPLPEMGAYVIMNVCAALGYAHSRTGADGKPLNIIHRDLSPSNVLVSFEGEVKLIDFGIAKAAERLYVTVGANLKGKYAYMSPEQAFGQPLDHRSDIFGAGTLLFELLTGRNPFRAESDLETLQRVQAARVPPPTRVVKDVPRELEEICLKALSQSPDDRFASAGEMQEALEAYSRRTAFGSRRMGRWMKEAFREEMERALEVVREAREQAQSAGGLQVVTTDELRQAQLEASPVDAGGATELAAAAARPAQPGPPVVAPTPTPTPTPMPTPTPPSPSTPPQRPVTGPTPPQRPVTGPTPPQRPVTGPTPPQRPVTGPVAPSGAQPAGVSGGGTPPGPIASPQAPATEESPLAVEYYPRARRTSMKVHAVIFLLILAGLGGAAYWFLGRTGRLPETPGGQAAEPAGGLKIVLDPPVEAEVLLDDTPHGTMGAGTVYNITGLLPGKHRVKLIGESFTAVENVVEVRDGKITELYLKVEKKAPAGAAAGAGEAP